MRIVGQDGDGRLVIDLEGEAFVLARSIPGDSAAIISNGIISDMPILDVKYKHLKIIDPRDSKNYSSTEIIEEPTDPIDSRFEILDL